MTLIKTALAESTLNLVVIILLSARVKFSFDGNALVKNCFIYIAANNSQYGIKGKSIV